MGSCHYRTLYAGRYELMGRSLQKYVDATGKSTLIADGTSNANISAASVSKYVRPMGRTEINNQLFNGYTWKKAFYLEPFGVQDFTLSASDPNDVKTSTMYQNPYWPMTAGRALE